MTPTPISVSVILPTVGRQSLRTAIESVKKQSYPVTEIIVVDDSENQKIKFESDQLINVVKTGSNVGPARARNLGMVASTGNIIAFLDDDDRWLDDHLLLALQFLQESRLDAVYSSASVGNEVRPEKLITGVSDPLAQVYSSSSIVKKEYFLPTPGLLIKREIFNHISFNELLRDREDLWFAHKIYEFGFKLGQSSNVTVQILENKKRKLYRSSSETDLNWYFRLQTVEKKASMNFMIFVAIRNSVLRGDIFGLFRLMRGISRASDIPNID